MKKHFKNISTFALVFAIVFVVSSFLLPQTVIAETYCELPNGEILQLDEANCTLKGGKLVNQDEAFIKIDEQPGLLDKIFSFAADALLLPFAWISVLILQITKLILWIAGVLLNHVVLYTIVNMSANLDKADVINNAWGKIRDLANMTFIFILLYAAIKTILGLGGETKKLIINVIIVAILINFSLFLTKVVIDASNVLAVTFYDAMVPGSLTLSEEELVNSGLSKKLAAPLELGSIIDTTPDGKAEGINPLESRKVLIVGLLGSIFVIVAAFVFFAMSLMLIIRFVVLMFVLILSPLAFLAFVLPALKDLGTKWKDALINQAFFAPIFFIILWIVMSIVDGIIVPQQGALATALGGVTYDNEADARLAAGSVAVIMNFIIIIVLLISSLLIAKSMSNRAGGAVTSLNKWAGRVAGGATFGVAGRLGRGTIGRAGVAIGESERLKERVAKGGVGGMAARLTLAAGRKTGGASIDVRGTGLGETLDAGKAHKGGFTEFRRKKAESEAKFATSIAPSAKAIAKNKALLGNKEEIDKEVSELEKEKQKRVEILKNSEEVRGLEVRERSAYDTVSRLETEANSAEETIRKQKIKELEIAKVKLEEIKKEAAAARERIKAETERVISDYDSRKEVLRTTEVKPVSETRKSTFAQTMENSYWAKARGYNYDAAAQIRKGKSAKDKAADILKDLQKEGVITEEEKSESPTNTSSKEKTPPTT